MGPHPADRRYDQRQQQGSRNDATVGGVPFPLSEVQRDGQKEKQYRGQVYCQRLDVVALMVLRCHLILAPLVCLLPKTCVADFTRGLFDSKNRVPVRRTPHSQSTRRRLRLWSLLVTICWTPSNAMSKEAIVVLQSNYLRIAPASRKTLD
mmetsp:Transcript_25325/g.57776  ORF Transcript_25325/g.57776 Transcript_25325/m.57776 type:complete len:150 (+) Transcript_25325:164-613(+)